MQKNAIPFSAFFQQNVFVYNIKYGGLFFVAIVTSIDSQK